MKNQYFKAIRYNNQQLDYDFLTCIHIKKDENIWNTILNKYFNNDNNLDMFYTDIKKYLLNDYTDIYSIIKISLLTQNIDISDPNIYICVATSYDYRLIDEKFNNEMKFLESMNLKIEEINKNRKITTDILLEAGFINITMKEMSDYYKNIYGQDNYSAWRIWTTKDIKDPNCLKLDIDNGPTNSGREWHLHIDNNVCNTIGSGDIDNVWQFNQLMKIFDSKFRL